MTGWSEAPPPQPARITAAGWVRLGLRGLALALVAYGGLLILLALRLIERPLFSPARPWTPHVTQTVCRAAMRIFGFGYKVTGRPMRGPGAIVANHAGWLDIFSLNAAARIYFVSKSDVAGWPGIGWLARATGTLFINRRSTEARLQQSQFEERLRAGHLLLFFPEGTSTDTRRVLPFKSSLFAAFWTHGMEHVMQIQPTTVVYHQPESEDPRFYGWWGNMDFAPHLMQVLAARRQGRVEVIFHPPVPVDGFENRKALASHCERVIRTSHPYAPA